MQSSCELEKLYIDNWYLTPENMSDISRSVDCVISHVTVVLCNYLIFVVIICEHFYIACLLGTQTVSVSCGNLPTKILHIWSVYGVVDN